MIGTNVAQDVDRLIGSDDEPLAVGTNGGAVFGSRRVDDAANGNGLIPIVADRGEHHAVTDPLA